MSVSRLPCAAWFGGERVDVSPIRGSAFSGSRVYRVRRPDGGVWVLKCFGGHVPPERAAWIHALMTHLRAGGLATVPAIARPLETAPDPAGLAAAGLVCDAEGKVWELVEFLPGTPRRAPAPAEAACALAGLARLHAVAETLPGAEAALEHSAGVARRSGQAARLLAGPWRELVGAAACEPHLPELMPRLLAASEILDSPAGRASLAAIAAVAPTPVRVHSVLRDVWSDHVLFHGDGRLAGFVDYHAAGRDTPLTDVARLLGSWQAPPGPAGGSLTDRWRESLAAYAALRPLAPCDLRLIDWLHAAGVICGLDNWFRWLIVERRVFADGAGCLERIDRLLAQVPAAIDAIIHLRPDRD